MQHATTGTLIKNMTITRVSAIPLNIEVAMPVPGGEKRSTTLSCVLARIDTACGLTGRGMPNYRKRPDSPPARRRACSRPPGATHPHSFN